MGRRRSNAKRPRTLFYQKVFLLILCLSSAQAGNNWYYKNIALGKPARQIDTAVNAGAKRATDGLLNGSFTHNACTMTHSSKDTWWVVDLLNSNYIYALNLKNRNGGTSDRLRNFYVYVSETNPLPLPPESGNSFPGELCVFQSEPIPPSGMHFRACQNNKALRGRYVYVWKPGDTGHLVLCEVEVLIRYPMREFSFTLKKNKSGEMMKPLREKSLSRSKSYIQCSVFCLNRFHVTFETMVFNKDSGKCSCFESKPFENTVIKVTNNASHEAFDIIERLENY